MEDIVQLMKETLVQVNEMYKTIELDKTFRKKIDWNSIAVTIFISKTRGR